MQRRPPSDVSDYWDIFVRRKRWIMLPALVVFSLAIVLTIKLPKSYKSETMILVDPQKVPIDYVKGSVGGDVTERLQAISQQILSRTSLQKIIDQLGLYKDQTKKLSQEDIVELMRKDIIIDVVAEKKEGNHSMGGFKISYAGQTPTQTQQVTRQLASLFIEENLKLRQQQAEGTNSFIDRQLEKSRQDLLSQEAKIKEFKTKYMGSLPEQQQANLAVMGQFQTLLAANSDAIGRAQQQKTYLESLSESMNKKTNPGNPYSGLQQDLNQRRGELVAAEQKYQANHPDVIRLREEVAAIEKQAKVFSAKDAAEAPAMGDTAQFKSQILSLDLELKTRQQRQAELETRIRGLQGKVDILPAIEQQFTELNRDYLAAKDEYRLLQEKKNSSSMAADVEREAQGEQFRVVDPASLPTKPYKPDLIQLNAIGLLLGVMIGAGFGAVQEMKDKSMHSDKDIAFYLPLTVLGAMPVIMNEETRLMRSKQRRQRWIISSGTIAVLVLLGIYVFMHRNAFDLAT
jgi:succinoglycan biosynthesis transport protein ExoP